MGDMKALVLGDSGGIGRAIADLLDQRGFEVTGLSRRDGLELTDQSQMARLAKSLGRQQFNIIFNATGALVIKGHQPEKSLQAIDAGAMAEQFALNATGVALILRYFGPLLHHKQRAVFASLSARVGSIGDNRLGGWISYRAAKAAHNQIIRTASIELARRHKQRIVVALHPGTVKTQLTQDYSDRYPTITAQDSAKALLTVIDGLKPEDNGTFWDWKGERVPW